MSTRKLGRFALPEYKLGRSSVYRVPLRVEQKHIDRTYPKYRKLILGVPYEENFEPINPIEASMQEQLGVKDIKVSLGGLRGHVSINGYGFTLDPHMFMWLKHWTQGRPVKPVDHSIDLYEGRILGEQ